MYKEGNANVVQVARSLRTRVDNVKKELPDGIVMTTGVDQSRFMPLTERPEDFDGKFWRTYNVLPDAMLVNWQSSEFTIRPADDGNGIELGIQPYPEGLVVENRVKLGSGRCVGRNNQVSYAIDAANVRLSLLMNSMTPRPAAR